MSDSNDSDTSSSDEEMELEEDEDTINLIRNQIQELRQKIEKNAFLYDDHIKLIELLRKVKDEDQLREARNKMRSVYPLTEELWLQWIKEDHQFDENYFKLAIQDYMSIEIWIEYSYFSMKKLGEVDGDNLVRGVYEEALIQVGLHPIKGYLIWEAYREFENVMLQSAQPPLGSVATAQQINKSNELTKKIEKLFIRQLAIPMTEMERTFEEYKSFINTDCKDYVLNAHKKALAYWQDIKPFEDKLAMISSCNIEIYKEYINFEISRQQPVRIQCIFERAIKDNCLDVSLWLLYITYVSKLNIESIVLPIHERSIRNCSWSCELWIKYLLALERYNSPEEKVKDVFNAALQTGFTQASDYLNLWSTYIDILRRRIDWSSENHEESLNILRLFLEKAITQLFESYGRDGDPNCSLQQYWAFIEAKYCKNITKARELWTTIMQLGFGDQARVWLEYISMERSFGDTKHCRKVFQRAINSVSDWPENICEAYILFEKQEGTLLTYEEALIRVEAQLKRINERRLNETLKETESKKKFKKNINGENKFDRNKNFKQATNSNSDLKPYQRKNTINENKPIRIEKTDKLDKPKFNTIEKNSSDNSLFKEPLVFGRKLSKEPSLDDKKRDFDSKSMPPPPPKNAPKRTNVDTKFMDELLAKKPKKDNDLKSNWKEFKEDQTIFVSNLDYSVTSDQLKDFFSKIGEISDVRLVTNFKKQSKGYAYVEFTDEFPVEEALKLDRELLDGRPMFVSRCESHRSDESKIKFNVCLEKNKLFVKNLLPAVTKEMLSEVFSKHGNLKEVRIVTFRNGHPKGLAYVEYLDQTSASQAVMEMDGFELEGQKMSVSISNPPPQNNPNTKQSSYSSSSSYVASLGGGKKDVEGRGNARTQISFLPRVFVRQNASSKTNTKLSDTQTDTSSDNQTQNKMSNDDFRSMLLKK